ncbi:MAG: hypothetical protein QOE15_684, partial [Acidimicrobiaceae bacterium]|nr:hypothetical protein [Acidimicrobiaceae bacterium]
IWTVSTDGRQGDQNARSTVPGCKTEPGHRSSGFEPWLHGAHRRHLALGTKAARGLFGRLGMAWCRVGEPHGSAGVVDAVPESASSGHFVLPLLHRFPIDRACTEASLERVLAVAAMSRIAGNAVPSRPCVRRSGGAHFVPSGYRLVGGVPEVPAFFGWRWCYSLSSLGQRGQLVGRATDSPSASIARRRRRASFGSACTSAVARHSRSSWLSGM